MNKRKRTIVFAFAVALIGMASAAVTLYQFTLGSGCLLLALTDLPCPTCGMTRATLCFISLRFTEAFGYHPLFWVPYLMAALGLGCIPNTRWRRLLVYCITALLIAFIAVWVARIAFFDWRG